MDRPTAASPNHAGHYVERENRLGAHNYHPLSVVVARAEGVFVWDVDGKRYYDCLSAYSAVNHGHCHPRILAALHAQSRRATLVSRAFYNDQLGRFYETLTELTGFGRVLPMNTGAEAIETAIKLARRWGYFHKHIPDQQAEIIVFDGNFHGRTTTIVGFSAEESYRRGFGPFAPGFRLVPFGDLEAVADAITAHTAGVLVEPIQGEAGIVVPPPGFLRGLRTLCSERGVLLIADEIQSGLGRTGRLLCCDHEAVRPDVLVLGKALSGGVYPVSAVLADDPVMSVFDPGSHGSTYGGNPLGAAVAVAALEALVAERMVDNAAELGEFAFARLKSMRAPVVAEVRGKGLWIGIELRASAGGARRFCESLRNLGVLCKETHQHVIRLAPPLVVTKAQLEEILTSVENVLQGG